MGVTAISCSHLLLISLLYLSVSGIVVKYPIDSNEKQCYGMNNDTTPAGLFGISVALSSGKNGQK